MSKPLARHALLVVLSVPGILIAQAPTTTPAPAGKGIIRGAVTAADTGRPIHRAEVRISSVGLVPPDSRVALTDEKGRFEATALRGGRYTLSAAKTGYLTLSYGQVRARQTGRPVELSESMPLDKIDFVLPRGSVIVARVLDQFGDPVRGVVVQAYLPRFSEGRRQLATAGGRSSVTDDRGETRIHGLQPGEYYLIAASDFQTQWRGEVETFYPGTLDGREAQTVRVGIGEEAFASFPIMRARLATLSGRIIGSDGAPLPSPRVSLENIRISGGGSSRRLNLAPDGSFREENLAPGDWMVVANEPEFGSVRVRLLGEDVHGLNVTTRKATTVRGRVSFEGGPPLKDPLQIGIAFDGPRTLVSGAGTVRSGGSLGSISTGPDKEWTFEAQVSGAGVIRAQRRGDWILKSVLLDGKDVTDTVLDFGTAYAGKPVEVVMTQRSSQVSGSVSDDRGQPANDYMVVLFSDDESQWTFAASRFFATSRPDQQGRFTITGLPAGRYLAAAAEYLEPGEDRNPETLSRLRNSATAIDLPEGESRSVTLRMSR
jgi:protocatechuate 3,4-dioxygenase beta subunit